MRAKFFILHYKYVPDMLAKRGAVRPAHLALAQEFAKKGMVFGGAFQDPIDSAEIMFESDSDAVVKDFVARDPYVTTKLVTSHYHREITVVAGSILNKQ